MDAVVELQVELRVGPDAIDGSMIPPDGARTAFEGWLELIDAVARLQAGMARKDRETGAPDD